MGVYGQGLESRSESYNAELEYLLIVSNETLCISFPAKWALCHQTISCKQSDRDQVGSQFSLVRAFEQSSFKC